ncbi:hypothetical protein JB92DRAFT_2281009 [Gautieria morchelliformis]|nr:hypothetical protein JB92DRAFT_2281009 [Gautieria morchelliformis]
MFSLSESGSTTMASESAPVAAPGSLKRMELLWGTWFMAACSAASNSRKNSLSIGISPLKSKESSPVLVGNAGRQTGDSGTVTATGAKFSLSSESGSATMASESVPVAAPGSLKRLALCPVCGRYRSWLLVLQHLTRGRTHRPVAYHHRNRRSLHPCLSATGDGR